MQSYQGRRTVVTGAASGMGEATTALLRAAGAEVHAIDIAPIRAEVASGSQCDLSDASQIESAIAEIGGPIDALFCCAGLAQTHPPLRPPRTQPGPHWSPSSRTVVMLPFSQAPGSARIL